VAGGFCIAGWSMWQPGSDPVALEGISHQSSRKSQVTMTTKTVFVKDLNQGQEVTDVFLLAQARQAQSKNGPYWDLKLQDCTGEVGAKIWHPLSAEFTSLAPEQFVRVRAGISSFRDLPQLIIRSLEILDPEEASLDWAEFIPASQRPPEDMLAELEQLCRTEIRYGPWKRLCKKILTDPDIRGKVLAAPGAKTIHHAYRGGLLEHTLAVSRLCLSIADRYPGLDRDILLVAAVLHDLGKAWELQSGLSRDYTDQGRLLGHIMLAMEILQPFFAKAKDLDPDLLVHLKHLLLSHHGEYAFGSPRRPKTQEAFVLHYADNLDAKLATARRALDGQDLEQSRWSGYQPSLERQLFEPVRSPDFVKESDKKEAQPKQCLLPLKE